MVVENQETILTCEYCGAQTKVLWKEGMIPNCEACGAPLRIDLQDKGQEPVYAAGTGQETTRARRGISPAKIILLIFANRKDMANPYIVVLTCNGHESEEKALAYLKEKTKRCTVKSKSAQKGSVELNLEVRLFSDDTDFINELSDLDGVQSAVLVSYNGDYMG